MLFRSATSWAIYFFCLLSNTFPDFGFVGRSVGKEKKPKRKWRSLDLGGLVPQHAKYAGPGNDKTWLNSNITAKKR